MRKNSFCEFYQNTTAVNCCAIDFKQGKYKVLTIVKIRKPYFDVNITNAN